MTKSFIEQQQEFLVDVLWDYLSKDPEEEDFKDVARKNITQVITNTGEELMRRAEGEQRDIEVRLLSEGVSRERIQQMDKYQALDTLKKHITSLTGVE